MPHCGAGLWICVEKEENSRSTGAKSALGEDAREQGQGCEMCERIIT